MSATSVHQTTFEMHLKHLMHLKLKVIRFPATNHERFKTVYRWTLTTVIHFLCVSEVIAVLVHLWVQSCHACFCLHSPQLGSCVCVCVCVRLSEHQTALRLPVALNVQQLTSREQLAAIFEPNNVFEIL